MNKQIARKHTVRLTLSGKLFEFVVLLEESEVAGFAVPSGGGGGAALLLLFLLLLVRHFVYLLSRLFEFSSRKSFDLSDVYARRESAVLLIFPQIICATSQIIIRQFKGRCMPFASFTNKFLGVILNAGNVQI